MSEETEVQDRIRARLNVMPGVRMWRNNVGFAKQERVRYGLAVGSADLIGLVDGWFFSLEVKTHRRGSRLSPDQKIWRETIESLGGFADVARDEHEAVQAVLRVRERIALRGLDVTTRPS